MGSHEYCIKIIADNLMIFMASILIKVNPFSINPVQPNRHSGGDF